MNYFYKKKKNKSLNKVFQILTSLERRELEKKDEFSGYRSGKQVNAATEVSEKLYERIIQKGKIRALNFWAKQVRYFFFY